MRMESGFLKNKNLLELYLNDYKEHSKEIEKILKQDITTLLKNPKNITYKDAMIIGEIFGMMPDELFYDDFTEDKQIKQKMNEAKKLHSITKNNT